MFTLYGDFDNFNFSSKNHIICAAPPASISDWTGFWSGRRGTYCPRASNNQLTKHTWHSSGKVTYEMGWKAGSKITRLGPDSNIFGVSTDGGLLTLWDETGVAVHSAPINLPSITGVRAVGGIGDWSGNVFVSNEHDRIYNVYWEGGWKEAEIDIDYHTGTDDVTLFFGSHEGTNYLFYGFIESTGGCRWATFYLYRLNFVGGDTRYEADLLRNDETVLFCGHNWRRRLGQDVHPVERKLCF